MVPISKKEFKELRHPKEIPRFYLTLLVLIPVGFLIAALTVATFGLILLAVPLILFFLWFGVKLAVANWMNNLVKVSELSFPQVNDAINDSKDFFGYHSPVDAYIIDDGSYNAIILPLLTRKFLLINSELLKGSNSADEMRFIVGRFVGSLAAKHFRFGWLSFLIDSIENIFIFNILLYPYERAVVLSGDRLGLRFIGGNANVAVTCLIKTQVGSEIASQVNIQGYISQGKQYHGSFFSWLARAFSRFPHNCTRVYELLMFADKIYGLTPLHSAKQKPPPLHDLSSPQDIQDSPRTGNSVGIASVSEQDTVGLDAGGVEAANSTTQTTNRQGSVALTLPHIVSFVEPTRAESSPVPVIGRPPISDTQFPPFPPIPVLPPATDSSLDSIKAEPSFIPPRSPPKKQSWWFGGSYVGGIAIIGVVIAKLILQEHERIQIAKTDSMLRGNWACTLKSPDAPDGVTVAAKFGIESERRIARYDLETPVADLPGVVAQVQFASEWAIDDSGNRLREYPVLIDIRMSGSGSSVNAIYDVNRLSKGSYEATLRSLSINGKAPPSAETNDFDRYARSSFIDPLLSETNEDSTIESISAKKLVINTGDEMLNCAK